MFSDQHSSKMHIMISKIIIIIIIINNNNIILNYC